jgi:rare lipoprotein A (peptidoglycan hydrolase)
VREVNRARWAVAIAALAIGACVSKPAPVEPRPRPTTVREREREPRPLRVLRGKAVWYGGKWHGRRTASGERFNKHAMTAAHRTLPLGSRIRVTNLDNQRSVILVVNDRGPYGRDRSRIIDVSEGAARRLGFHGRGWVHVKIEVLANPPTRSARERPSGRLRRR